MNQQLKRIKNKDFSQFDQKLFNNLDKVETINSTLQNLQKFQQFLLKQIGNFQQQAKQKNQQKQINQVITQNCQTLRQSILRAVPDMQSSRARFRQTIFSPLSHASNNLKFYKNNGNQLQISNLKANNQQIRRLSQQLSEMKNNIQEIKYSQKEMNHEVMHNGRKMIEEKLFSLLKENSTLKKANCKLKEQNQRLNVEISSLKQKISKKQDDVLLREEKLSRKVDQSQFSSKTYEKKQDKIHSSQLKPTANTYLSFMQKMKLDFTAKLQKSNKYDSVENYAQPSTFRQSQNLQQYNPHESMQKTLSHYSTELQNIKLKQMIESPDIPRPLRSKSIHSRSNAASQTSIQTKHRLPLAEQNFFSSSNTQNSHQNNFSCEQKYLTHQKKSNHDLARKTKSKFFKKQSEGQNIYETNIAKIKGLQNNLNPQMQRKRTASKQKLRIFSIL